ncbi:putative major tail protein [Corynebacterium phage phi674]|uniref:Putative major tail protein n=1 Tax=Corynebacterium phage phi674 TaxID=2052822 RepID=A0A2H4PIX5_9CAUD|nr:putative major tail protein [Corynebacterium phage phi674]ATW62929.1 putative major tail protein [Corynebacterium phage phi674]
MAGFMNLTEPNFAPELSRLGVTGALSYAPYGTPMPPANTLDPYTAPIVNMGWISDAGITETINDEVNSFTPLQATGPIKSSISSREMTFQATFWSIGGLANALYYGVPEDKMTYDAASGITTWEEGAELPEDFRFFLPIDILEGDKHRRYLLPAASVVERGDITHTKTDMTGYQMTFRANLDPKTGYSIKRMFREGWKPGTAGTTLSDTTPSLGDWSTDVNANTAAATFAFALTGATGGTFDLRVGSSTATNLPTSTTSATLQAILRAQGQDQATVTGTDAVAGYTIKKVTSQPVVDATKVTGTGYPKTITVTKS